MSVMFSPVSFAMSRRSAVRIKQQLMIMKISKRISPVDNSQAFTSETVCIKSGVKCREACLVAISIHSVYSRFPSSAFSAGIVDWIPDATIN